MTKKSLILAGIIGRYPVGGVTWCALQYIAGFQRLGYKVFYLEDTGECPYDPRSNGASTDPAYPVSYIGRQLETVGLGSAWTYIDYKGGYHGRSHERVMELCREADLMVNLSGGCWFDRPEYSEVRKVFIDTDPGFTQQAIYNAGPGWYRDILGGYDAHFTFAQNVDSPGCHLAETPFRWQPTVQPVVLDFWPPVPVDRQAPLSTVMSWRIDSFPSMGKGKAADIMQMIDLPSRSQQRILLAISGRPPLELLAKHGWEVTDGVQATIDPDSYRRFIQSSRAELGFAKAMYVETHSGWFSDRSQCYLASGRPVLARNTGFDEVLPCGEGLLPFDNEEDVIAGMERIDSDYPRHAGAARELAREYFASDRVLSSLLARTGV